MSFLLEVGYIIVFPLSVDLNNRPQLQPALNRLVKTLKLDPRNPAFAVLVERGLSFDS
jgi:hypothetical protein